jgi:sulfinoalanine decarboxylase/sulfinoalanine decarboxylase/aspartate 1-decarboxylase
MQNSLDRFNRIVKDLLEDEKNRPVADYISSEELLDRLDLSLSEEAISDDKFESILKELVLNTPRTATNAFFNQLYGGRNETAVLGDLLSVVMNNSMYTYKAAGAQVGVEKAVLRKVCDILGWGPEADGTFASGGSLTNFMSMIMARDHASVNSRFKGVRNEMVVYTSSESHYSIPKNAAFCGIGRDNVRYIPVDDQGRMIPDELESIIERDVESGLVPVMVNLTAGTTVLGAFDPIESVAAICEKHDIWLHVDGAYCGSVLFSDKYKHLIKGIENVNSFSFNAHKMIGTPLTCSIIVTRDKKHMYDSFTNEASYLYQTEEDDFNLGKRSLQCGRRNDALKFWSVWKSVGTTGLQEIVDHQFELADIAREYVRNNPDYTLYSYDNSISICFNYKGIPAKEICAALYERSKLMVSYGNHKEEEFIRLVTINAQNEKSDILNFFKVLESFVAEEFGK